MDATHFPARLRELRERAGMTQPQLADKVKISARQISRLETGAQTPTWPTVLALAEALGVDANAFTVAPAAEQASPVRGRPVKAVEPPAPKKPPRRKPK